MYTVENVYGDAYDIAVLGYGAEKWSLRSEMAGL